MTLQEQYRQIEEEMKAVRDARREQLNALSRKKRRLRDQVKAAKLRALEKRNQVAGSVMLRVAQEDPALRIEIWSWLDRKLEAAEDRAMFDLAPREETP